MGSTVQYLNIGYAVISVVCMILFFIGIKKSLYRYSNIVYLTCVIFFVSLFAPNLSRQVYVVRVTVALMLIISNIALVKHEGFRKKNLFAISLALCNLGFKVIVDLLSLSNVLGDYMTNLINLGFCYFESFLVATAIMGYMAACQKPAYDKDFIIIPGCLISKEGGLLPLLKGRTNRAVKYAWDQEIASGKPLKYIPSGGQGPNEVMSEGSAMELYLCSHGAEPYEVITEKESVNTFENFLFSRTIIRNEKPDAKIAFCTTNYHMLRSGLIAYKLGIKDIEGISSSTKWYFWPNGFVREFIAIVFMELVVHIAALGLLMMLSYIITYI